MAKAKAAEKKQTKKKPSANANFSEIKFEDFIGQRFEDMSNENGVLTIKFSNGYNIVVSGKISLKKEKTNE